MWQGDTRVFIRRYNMIRWMEECGIEVSGLALATSVGQAGPPCGGWRMLVLALGYDTVNYGLLVKYTWD